MRMRMFTWLIRAVGAVIGIWVADVLLPGVRLDGSPAGLFLGAALVVVATVTVPAPAVWLLDKAAERAEDAYDPGSVLAHIDALRIVLGLLVWSLVAPFALLLASRADLGLSVSGYGTAMAAALTVAAVWPIVSGPFQPAAEIVWQVFKAAVTVGALATAVGVVGGVRLEPGPGWLQTLELTVLAMIYNLAWFEINIRFLTVAVRLTLCGFKLWALAWLSGWSETPVRIDGFWNLALMAVLVTVTLWPLVLRGEKQRDAIVDPDRGY